MQTNKLKFLFLTCFKQKWFAVFCEWLEHRFKQSACIVVLNYLTEWQETSQMCFSDSFRYSVNQIESSLSAIYWDKSQSFISNASPMPMLFNHKSSVEILV